MSKPMDPIEVIEECLLLPDYRGVWAKSGAIAILAALEKEGYVVLPKVPTEDMLYTGHNALPDWDRQPADVGEAYIAIIAARMRKHGA